MSKIVCFGEVLFDVFPTHEKIGGAPLNVANRLSAFQHKVSMISAVGNDDYGHRIITYLKKHQIDTSCIQLLETFETGKVKVALDQNGSASYTIKHPSAWDHISMTETSVTQVQNADAFVFGSLVARDATSRHTLYELLEVANYKVFDLNLRPPHYDSTVLKQLMKKADFIKCNDEELFEVCKTMGLDNPSLVENVSFLANQTHTNHLCVTRGKDGALLWYEGKLYENKGYPVEVKDTVGAGDSFLGALISELLIHQDPEKALDFASAIGALVAKSEGANPVLKTSDIETMMHSK